MNELMKEYPNMTTSLLWLYPKKFDNEYISAYVIAVSMIEYVYLGIDACHLIKM